MTMAEITLDRIDKTYPNGFDALHGLTLHVADGEFLVLVGPSGCGKSTALRIIAGLEDISHGVLEIDGRVVNDVEPKNRDVAMVFQNYALYPHMTVAENIGFTLKLAKTPKRETARRVEAAAQVLELTEQLHKKPGQLSGGQRQRVAMGRAIVREPAAFLMDEPLSRSSLLVPSVCPLFVPQRNADQTNTMQPDAQPKPAYTCDYATR